jgi:hypothetical protein
VQEVWYVIWRIIIASIIGLIAGLISFVFTKKRDLAGDYEHDIGWPILLGKVCASILVGISYQITIFPPIRGGLLALLVGFPVLNSVYPKLNGPKDLRYFLASFVGLGVIVDCIGTYFLGIWYKGG